MTIEVKDESNISSIVQTAISRYGATPDALIPILSEVNQKLGYLPDEAMSTISRSLRLPGSQLLGVTSFYRMLATKPHGQHVIQCCESAPCHVMGGRRVWAALREELGLEPGQTSANGQWTLLAVSCPGLCGVGPVLMVDEDLYGNVSPERVTEIVAKYEGVTNSRFFPDP